MAECAHVALEQLVLGRIVQVDVVGVGEHELHLTQRVLVSGPLSEPLPSAYLHHLVVVAREIVGIGFDLWPDLVLGDFLRHRPVGRELDVGHGVGECRRGAILVFGADDDSHIQNVGAVVVRIQAKSGDVHIYITITQLPGQPAESFEIRHDLPCPVLGRRIQRSERFGPHHAVDDYAVARLKRRDGPGEALVVYSLRRRILQRAGAVHRPLHLPDRARAIA